MEGSEGGHDEMLGLGQVGVLTGRMMEEQRGWRGCSG